MNPIACVLDSSAIFAVRGWTSPEIEVLRQLAELGELEVLVPTAVSKEMARHQEDWRKESRAALKKAERALLGVSADLSERTKALRGEIDGLSADDFARPPAAFKGVSVPRVDLERLLAADLRNEPPWRDGKGFRDALIWESVLAAALDIDGVVAFVTKNTQDFASPNGGLAEPLKAQLESESGGKGRVTLYASLRDLEDALRGKTDRLIWRAQVDHRHGDTFAPDLPVQSEIDRVIAEGMAERAIVAEVASWLEGQLILTSNDLYDHGPSGIDGTELPPVLDYADEIRIAYAGDDPVVDILETIEVYEDLELVRVSVGLSLSADIMVHKADYYSGALDESHGLSLSDGDWNDHFVWAALQLRSTVTGQALVQRESGRVEGVEALEVVQLDVLP